MIKTPRRRIVSLDAVQAEKRQQITEKAVRVSKSMNRRDAKKVMQMRIRQHKPECRCALCNLVSQAELMLT